MNHLKAIADKSLALKSDDWVAFKPGDLDEQEGKTWEAYVASRQ